MNMMRRECKRVSILTCGPGSCSTAEDLRIVAVAETMASNNLNIVIEIRVGPSGEVDPAGKETEWQIVENRSGHSISKLSG